MKVERFPNLGPQKRKLDKPPWRALNQVVSCYPCVSHGFNQSISIARAGGAGMRGPPGSNPN